jgi:hypothetical protein
MYMNIASAFTYENLYSMFNKASSKHNVVQENVEYTSGARRNRNNLLGNKKKTPTAAPVPALPSLKPKKGGKTTKPPVLKPGSPSIQPTRPLPTIKPSKPQPTKKPTAVPTTAT